jgi:hypothetical protein
MLQLFSAIALSVALAFGSATSTKSGVSTSAIDPPVGGGGEKSIDPPVGGGGGENAIDPPGNGPIDPPGN